MVADVTELNGNIFQLDLRECGHAGRTAGYFIQGKNGWMLIETGPASSFEYIEETVKLLGIKPARLKYIAVTHIHLDHAGGLGVASKYFENSKVIVHPKGARHMIDPSRLVAGAYDYWGKAKMEQYGEVLPVAEEKVITVTDGDIIDLGDRKIEVWETPGHSKNHVCYYDTKTKGIFSGDALGVYFPKLSLLLERPVIRLATPAPDFNGELMIKSIIRVALSKIKKIYFTHFGVGDLPQQLIENTLGQLNVFLQMAKNYSDNTTDKTNENSKLMMLKLEMEQYVQNGLLVDTNLDNITEQDWDFQISIIEMSADGIWQYLKKERQAI